MRERLARLRPEHWLLLAAALLLLSGLGLTDLWAPDEPRYAQVAEEMRSFEKGPSSLILLQLNGEPYAQKPPGYFWLAAALGAPLGRVTEIAARLPSALAGIALVWITFWLGRQLLGPSVGLLGGAILLTTFDFAWMARRAQLDVLLALFEALALVAFWRASEGMGSRSRNLLAMHAALGAGLLVKGPVGFLVPILVMAATLAARRRLRSLPSLLPLPALLLSLGPALVWLWAAAALAPPEWLDEAVGRGVFQRFFTGSSHVRPFYYYLYHLPGDFLPWTLLWPLIFFAGRRSVFTGRPEDAAEARTWTFLLAWVGVSVLFFSLSAGKRGVYLLPTFPALALLCAAALLRMLEGLERLPRALSWGTAFLFGLLALVAVAASLAPLLPQPDVHMARLSVFGLLSGGVVLLSILAWRRMPASGPLSRRVWIPVATVFGVELAAFLLALPALDPGKSPRPIAAAAARWTGEDGRIGLYGQRPRVAGLRYYGDRPVVWEETLEGVVRFVEEGGRVLVIRQRELEEVQERIPVEVLARFRSGRRGLLVVGPRGTQGGSRAEDPPPAAAQDSARMADP